MTVKDKDYLSLLAVESKESSKAEASLAEDESRKEGCYMRVRALALAALELTD